MSGAFEDVPWLLVTGQGRSGTTALTRAIAAHPHVCSNRVESNVVKDILLAGFASSTVESRVRQMVLAREDHDREFRRFLTRLLFPESLWKATHAPARLSTYSALNPDAAEFATAALPGIHFLNIVRNGIEVVSSRMVHRVMGSQPFEAQCLAWAAAVEMVQWGRDRNGFTLVRHEQLIQEASCRQTVRTVLERAGLAENPRVADYLLSERRNQTTWSGESGNGTDGLDRRLDRWKQWSPEQRGQFEELCGAAMEYFGYEIPWQNGRI